MSDGPGNVVSLARRRIEASPHRQGEARCLNCKRHWQAVAPAGTTSLECPSCHTTQGVFIGLSQTERAQWQCKCGEWMFFIDEAGPYCCHCGTRPSFP